MLYTNAVTMSYIVLFVVPFPKRTDIEALFPIAGDCVAVATQRLHDNAQLRKTPSRLNVVVTA